MDEELSILSQTIQAHASKVAHQDTSQATTDNQDMPSSSNIRRESPERLRQMSTEEFSKHMEKLCKAKGVKFHRSSEDKGGETWMRGGIK